MKSLAIVLGTRPEIIKLAPLITAVKKAGVFTPRVIFTGQHRSMAEQAFQAFGITPDVDLSLMTPGQTPNSFLGSLLPALERRLLEEADSGVIAGMIVQGDTTSTLGGALSAFHLKIPIAHVEAGLRTHNPLSPFPEELNRTLVSKMTELHFCHTEHARDNLQKEGITEKVFVVGNTVVDALKDISMRLQNGSVSPESSVSALPLKQPKMLLVTGHRRENFDGPMENLCEVLKRLIHALPDIEIVFPVHLNPSVQRTVLAALGNQDRVHLIAPVDYPSFVSLMKRANLIISDSGGVQEEAPSLGKRVLVTRESTERPEASWAGCSEVLPLDRPEDLFQRAKALLESDREDACMINPYGSGDTSDKIARVLVEHWSRASLRRN